MAKYARALTFPTEQAAKEWVERVLNRWDNESWSRLFGKNGPEKNKIIASLTPLYQSGKSFKIGKRIRTTKKSWDGVEIRTPSISGILEAGFINPFDGYDVHGVHMLPVRLLHMTEDHSNTPSGQEKVYRYAQRVKADETFLAIIVEGALKDSSYTILDGHHRFRAVRDVLKWKKIPCLIVESLED